MLQHYRRLLPFLLAGVLVFNLVEAVMDRTQSNWLNVGILALLLAFTLWRRARKQDNHKPPTDGR